eukprot:13691350-Alexandrium_andersonii.AAC.1
MQQRRGCTRRSAVDRAAASPWTPFPSNRQTCVACAKVLQCCKRAHSPPPVGQRRRLTDLSWNNRPASRAC